MSNPSAIAFLLPGTAGVVVFDVPVLLHLLAHRQMRRFAREAGGQLFANLDDPKIMRIVEATGPRLSDKRSIFGYRPNRTAERAEIRDRYARGLHFVGDWHTHAQNVPLPSDTDMESMQDMVAKSNYDISGFVLVIVGRLLFPDGLHVSFYDKQGGTVLSPCAGVPEMKTRSAPKDTTSLFP